MVALPCDRMGEHRYDFVADLWEHHGEAPWVFMTVPAAIADEIADLVPKRTGFGSVKVTVQIGATRWSTSLFPSKELGSYVLPVKRAVRTRESLEIGTEVAATITIGPD